MVGKIIIGFIMMLLLANFCWEGKPLYKHILPGMEEKVETAVKEIKEGSKKTVTKTKNVMDKTGKGIEEGIKKTKDTVTSKIPSEFSKEDREKLEQIIKERAQKQ